MVKCNATGVIGDSSTFYKVNNKWYQSEDVYLEYMGDKVYRVKVVEKLLEFLNEDRLYGNIGGFVGKKIKDCKMSCKELYESLCDREDYIKENLCDKTKFTNPHSQITAIFTVASIIPESITYGGCYEIKNLDNGEDLPNNIKTNNQAHKAETIKINSAMIYTLSDDIEIISKNGRRISQEKLNKIKEIIK